MSGGGDQSAPSNPSGAVLLTRAETRAVTGALTKYAPAETACPKCARMMGPEERFCAGCGHLRHGLDPEKFARGESRTEAAWREVQERLQAATAGRYEVIRELGRGGMAAVYLAREVALKREVAIKVMRPSFLLDEGMVDRFMREARTMASLHHPNIVTIHAVEEVDQLHFFVMQFIAGRPLDEVIRETGPLPVAAVQAILFQAATGLTHAHKQGVIHRDIKPANIMLDRDGNAIVTDFGIAKVADVQATSATVGPMGTPLYMSPEQCSGAALTPAADQYSLGNVAYEMLTGSPPFVRPTAMALGVAIMGEKPKPIRESRKDCPADVEAAVLRMLAKDPKDRFANLAEAMAALGGDLLADDDPVREFLRALAKKESRPDGRRLTPRASKSGPFTRGQWTGYSGQGFRRRIIVLGFGGLAVVSFGGYFLYRRLRPPDAPPPAAAPFVAAAEPPPAAREPGPAPPPAAPNASPGEEAAQLRKLIASARTAMGSRSWGPAADLLARALALDPRNVEVKTLLGEVARGRIQDSVAATAQAGTQIAAAPAPTPPPPAVVRTDTVVKTVEPARPRHEAEIRRAVDEYVHAINARSLTELRAIYPGLTPKQEKDWKDRFGKDIKKLAATLTVRSVDEAAESAHAAFDLGLVLEPDGSAPLNFRIQCDATLKNEGGGWKIVSLTERGG